jgi:phospholipase/lecithinase/hemolysin
MHLRKWFCGLGIALLFALPCRSEIVVFGDSLSDVGNIYDVMDGSLPDSSLGYYSGRFANGPVWVEHLALLLNEPVPTPSRNGGRNYAHGGSLVDHSLIFRPNLADQVFNLSVASSTDLHIIWAGGNDMLDVDLSLPTESQNTIAKQVVGQINNNIDRLYSIGARRFLVLNLPPLGDTPLARATLTEADAAKLNSLSAVFNWELEEELFKATLDNPGIDIIGFDVHSVVTMAIENPGTFGLTNVTDSATEFDLDGSWFFPAGVATAPPAPGVDPDLYLFYDGLHPTAVGHEILGTMAALAVTQPTVNILTVDPTYDDLFYYDLNGVLQDQGKLGSGNNAPRGIAANRFRRWVIDDDDFVYVYDTAGKKIGAWKALGLSLPDGIAIAGNNVLIVDRGLDRVLVYANALPTTSGSLTATSSWPLSGPGNTNPKGIKSNGVSVWVVNSATTDRVYKYDLNGTYRGRWNLDVANSNPSGISLSSDGLDLSIVDATSDKLYRYSGSAARTTGSQASDAVIPLNSANSNVQGVAEVFVR